MDETLEQLYNETMRIKQLVFNLQDKVEPATNKNIAKLNETWTFHRLLNQIRGRLETMGNCLTYTMKEDNYYFIQMCPKCSEKTFHKDTGVKTCHCVVCWKRNYKEKML